MGDDPVGHESAIGSAGLAEPVFIDRWIPSKYFIDKIHQVLEIGIAVSASDVRKCVTSAVRALDVGKHDEVALRSPQLHLVEKGL